MNGNAFRIGIVSLWLFSGVLAVSGCRALYQAAGYSALEAADMVAQDESNRVAAVGEGMQLSQESVTVRIEQVKETVNAGRRFLWQLITAVVSVAAALTTTLLTRALSGERRVTAALIKGIEKAPDNPVKSIIQKTAIEHGVEAKLHKRVKKLAG